MKIALKSAPFLNVFHCSDAHNEHTLNEKSHISAETYYPKPKGAKAWSTNVLLLSGDMLKFKSYSMNVLWLEKVCSTFDHVVYVFGNHEFYNTNLDRPLSKLKEKTSHIDNLSILENEDVVFKIGRQEIAVIGATLWMDFDSSGDGTLINKNMSSLGYYNGPYDYAYTDFKAIRHKKGSGYARITPEVLASKFAVSKKFIFEKALKHKKLGRLVFALTHHSPSYFSASHFDGDTWLKGFIEKKNSLGVAPTFGLEAIGMLSGVPFEDGTQMYCSHLEKSVYESEIDFWGHGHIHKSALYMLGKTLVDNNPYGYYKSRNKAFREGPVMTIEVKHC